jgi:opacity protein-like surface antigen
MKKNVLALAILAVIGVAPAQAAQPTMEEKLEILQQEVEALRGQFLKVQATEATGGNSGYGMSGAAAGSTTIGGYGEIVLNNYRDPAKKDEADLKRFVLFIGHKFNDRLRLVSELEIEHAKVDKDGGEVAMEQAYIEYGINNKMNARAGMMLMPLGITNETHEPPTFYGVERTEVESRIIPSTWRELGIALQGEAIEGLEYNAGMSTSPDASKYKDASKGFRDMRTSGRQAPASDFGVFAALNYRGVPGLLLGGSVFSGNTAHNGNGTTVETALMGVDARLTVWDLHAKYSVRDLDLQALYAEGTLADTDKINTAVAVSGTNKAAPKKFFGWYGQAAYHVWKSGDLDVAPFMRYERYNTQQEVDLSVAGNSIDPKNNETVTTIGVNVKLHPQVVLKADVQNYKADNSKDRVNLGLGYMF